MKKKVIKEVVTKVVEQKVTPVIWYKSAYIFTNWGLVKGVVVAERIDRNTGILQYKLNIDIDRNNRNIVCNFWYTGKELHKSYFVTLVLEIFKPFGWFVKGLFKRK